jgi:protein SCO1/2
MQHTNNAVPFLQPVSWASLALLLMTGGGLLAFYDREKRRKLETVRQGPSVGKAAIGGAFELVNQDGKKVTDKDFRGNWNLVYFGFTFCPDICPDELNKMAEAIDKVRRCIRGAVGSSSSEAEVYAFASCIS